MENEKQNQNQNQAPTGSAEKLITKIIAIAIFAWLIMFTVPRIVQINEPGTGSVTTFLGGVSDRSWQDGPVYVIPFVQENIQFDIKNKTEQYTINLKTKDFQNMSVECQFVHKLNGEALHIYIKEFGKETNYNMVLVEPILKSTLQALAGTRSAAYFFEQPKVFAEAVNHILQDQMLAYNDMVIVRGANLFEPSFDPEFEAAVLEKVIRGQNIETEKYQTSIEEEKAKQLLAKLTAEAEGLKLRSAAMTNPLIVEYEIAKALQNWKGDMPSNLMMGTNPATFMSWPSNFRATQKNK